MANCWNPHNAPTAMQCKSTTDVPYPTKSLRWNIKGAARCSVSGPAKYALRHGFRQLERERENPCEVVVEYLHRDAASRRKRRKGKSQIWDSKIRSQVPKDLDPRKTALARASCTYKRQSRPLVKEDAQRKQERNCQREINIWSCAPDGVRYQALLTDWPLVAMWFWLELERVRKKQ
jgi:hypothetical protein